MMMRSRCLVLESLGSAGLVPGVYSWGGGSGRSCPMTRVQYAKVLCLCALGVVKAGQSWCVVVARLVLITAVIAGAWHQL